MTELPPVPQDPAELKAWVEALGRDDLMALAQQITTGGLGALAGPIPRNPEIDLPPPPDPPCLLTMTIELRGSKPRIWRRLTLPGDLTLDAVHTIFQAAMGWSDSHMHRFAPGAGRGYDQPSFITEFDEEEGEEGTREDGVRLDQVLRAPGGQLTYLYDFGDGWEHRVKLESTAPLTQENRQPSCLAGARACPPEDVGGIRGHQELAAWLRAGAPADDVPDPFEDAEQAHGWLPDRYDPDAFDADDATAAMQMWAAGEHLPWHSLPEPLADLIKSLSSRSWDVVNTWLDALGPRHPQRLDDDDVQRAARPWLAVLQAVGPGAKLSAAGYLPPATAELRENAQALGLLRKSKGLLTPDRPGTRFAWPSPRAGQYGPRTTAVG